MIDDNRDEDKEVEEEEDSATATDDQQKNTAEDQTDDSEDFENEENESFDDRSTSSVCATERVSSVDHDNTQTKQHKEQDDGIPLPRAMTDLVEDNEDDEAKEKRGMTIKLDSSTGHNQGQELDKPGQGSNSATDSNRFQVHERIGSKTNNSLTTENPAMIIQDTHQISPQSNIKTTSLSPSSLSSSLEKIERNSSTGPLITLENSLEVQKSFNRSKPNISSGFHARDSTLSRHGSKGHGTFSVSLPSSMTSSNDLSGPLSSENVKSFPTLTERLSSLPSQDTAREEQEQEDAEEDESCNMSDDNDQMDEQDGRNDQGQSSDSDDSTNPFESTFIQSNVEDLCRGLHSDISSDSPTAFNFFTFSFCQVS